MIRKLEKKLNITVQGKKEDEGEVSCVPNTEATASAKIIIPDTFRIKRIGYYQWPLMLDAVRSGPNMLQIFKASKILQLKQYCNVIFT